MICRYIISSGKCSFTFMSLLIIFLALLAKVHFSLKNHQQEIALSPLPGGGGVLLGNTLSKRVVVPIDNFDQKSKSIRVLLDLIR